ncbi:DNA-processing protein DprA [Streptomyces sp. NPDC049097]|uniref:DNA-processing protein DprA n=1 Tax=Streptomyces sp. NPDC049097 TaxID=3155497 RepID=UPI003423344B
MGARTRAGARLTARAVAVTGNRVATAQALARAQALATALAAARHTVTATLAGLPRSLDRAHSHNHAQLLGSIPAGGGAVVSLFRPGTPASGATLQSSAALLTALVRAVVLIEAVDYTQAAMHTAEVAADLDRPLLVTPPPTRCTPTATSACSPSSTPSWSPTPHTRSPPCPAQPHRPFVPGRSDGHRPRKG